MKINFITFGDEKRGSTRIRVIKLMEALIKRGWHCSINDYNLAGYDAIVFQKTPLRKDIQDLIYQARSLDIPIILDLDDYSLEMVKILKYFDMIIVSTSYLADICSRYHSNVKIIKNMLDIQNLNLPLKKRLGHKKVVWYGYSQNNYILKKWKIQNVTKISDKKADIIYDVHTIDKQIQKHDLVIIPQEKKEETLSKTHCRMLKALYLGVPCMVSDMPVYLELAQELNFPAQFIIKNPEDWNSQINSFKKGAITFDFDFEKARKTILKNYSSDVIAEHFQKVVKQLLKTRTRSSLAVLRKGDINPLVSVIIPIEKANTGWEISLESILNGDLYDLEIILVYKKYNILPQNIKTDPRIKLIHCKNWNLNRAWNLGQCAASGKYIYFFTPGDWLEKDALKKLSTVAEVTQADIVKTKGIFVHNREIVDEKVYIPLEKMDQLITTNNFPEFLADNLAEKTSLFNRTFLMKKNIFHSEPIITKHEDIDFACAIERTPKTLFILSKSFTHVQRNSIEQPAIQNKNHCVLLILNKEKELPQMWVVLSDIIKMGIKVYLYSSIKLSYRIQKKLSIWGNNLEIIPYHMTGYHSKLNLLFNLIKNWNGPQKILYLSNNCLIFSDINHIFNAQFNKKSFLCRSVNNLSDTNVILFSSNFFKKNFRKSYLQKKYNDKALFEKWLKLYSGKLPEKWVTFYSQIPVEHEVQITQIKILCYDKEKPWKMLGLPLGYLWWKKIFETPYYKISLTNNKEKSNNGAEKKQILSDQKYFLMKEYLNEFFLYLFSFGENARRHKNNLNILYQNILKTSGK